MSYYVFMNDKDEFVCLDNTGKLYSSKTDFKNIILYPKKENAEKMINDKNYWYNFSSIKGYKVSKIKLHLEVENV